jgi:hypothetical protein
MSPKICPDSAVFPWFARKTGPGILLMTELGGSHQNSTGMHDSSAAVLAMTPATMVLAGLIRSISHLTSPESKISGP